MGVIGDAQISSVLSVGEFAFRAIFQVLIPYTLSSYVKEDPMYSLVKEVINEEL